MITESFDPNPTGVILPSFFAKPVPGMPKVAVTCFSHTLFSRLAAELCAEPIEEVQLGSANGKNPVCRVSFGGSEFTLFLSPVGAPACVGLYEELFETGVESIVVFGTCGVLDGSIRDCSIVLPTEALRDEGTSYHYAPARETIEVNAGTLALARETLDALGVSYTTGKVWTTDAVYRETRGMVERRKAQGCIAVDMECSAIAALCAMRGKTALQFFYAADNLDGEQWDKRSLSNEANLAEKDRVAFVALKLAERLMKQEDA